jgi:phosphoserine phosphatase
MKLAVLDFDSTLMDGETIDFFAEPLGLMAEVAAITEEAMAGRMDFFMALVARAKLLQGLDVRVAEQICANLPVMPGAWEAIDGLKERGYRVVCFSGGFRQATQPMSERLGIDADFANFLYVDEDGKLTGEVGGEMMYGDAKGDMLSRLQKLMGIGREDTLVVGDGANDLSMFAHADTRIAFNAREVLRQAATHTIDVKDLSVVLEIVR